MPCGDISSEIWSSWISKISTTRLNRLFDVLIADAGKCFAADKVFPLSEWPASLTRVRELFPSVWDSLLDVIPVFENAGGSLNPLAGFGENASPLAGSVAEGAGLAPSFSAGASPSVDQILAEAADMRRLIAEEVARRSIVVADPRKTAALAELSELKAQLLHLQSSPPPGFVSFAPVSVPGSLSSTDSFRVSPPASWQLANSAVICWHKFLARRDSACRTCGFARLIRSSRYGCFVGPRET